MYTFVYMYTSNLQILKCAHQIYLKILKIHFLYCKMLFISIKCMIQLDQGLLSNTYCFNVDFVENSLNGISQIFVLFPNTLFVVIQQLYNAIKTSLAFEVLNQMWPKIILKNLHLTVNVLMFSYSRMLV